MAEENLISVIIPVYNTELYLERCVDSIINQTYRCLEIILVDDGSTDRSSEICDSYQKKDTRVKVIHKQNGGAATARNIGLEIAKGQFIGFVDSDDSVLADMYESLLSHMNEEVDIVTCGRYVYKEGSCSLKRKVYCADKLEKFDNAQAIQKLLRGEVFSYGVNEKIYRKKLFENVRFPHSRMSEDIPVTYALFKKSRNIVNVGNAKYCNYLRRDSSSNSDNYFLRIKYVYFIRDIFMDIEKEYPQYLRIAEAEYMRSALWLLQEMKQGKNRQKYFKLERRLVVFFKRMIFRLIINNELSEKEKKVMIKNAKGLGFNNYTNI